MNVQLIYHDLIDFPNGWRRSGIYWLRLFQKDSGYVAIVTEVPGNPSLSVTNGIVGIAHYVIEKFQITTSGFSLYQIHPDILGRRPSNIRRVTIDYSQDYSTDRWHPSWSKVTRQEIESEIGTPLPELPAHENLYPRVLDRGGGIYQDIYRDIFGAVDVKDLPPFHNPGQCAHSLTAEDTGSCHYHQADWKAIADESVRIITESDQQDVSVYRRAAYQSPLKDRDRRWLGSLFDDPITIRGGSYGNGHHRGCALRFSGAARAAVVVGSEMVDTRCGDWHYHGNG